MHKRFFIIALTLTAFVFASYGILIDRAILKTERPVRLSHLLLENSTEVQKIIITAGSNARRGFDALAIEQHFQRPTIIFSEHADYPLKHRIYSLLRYAQAGDIVILPLEWHNYSENGDIGSAYLKRLFGRKASTAFYYRNLPISERAAFIYTEISLNISLDGLIRTVSTSPSHGWSMLEHMTALNSRSRGGLVDEKKGKGKGVIKKSCDEFIFKPQLRPHENNWKISQTFRDNLQLLKRLTDKGVDIVFTTPTVVDSAGNNCYTTDVENFERFLKNVTYSVRESGFYFIGNYRDSLFTSNCFLDSYYHIKASCTKRRSTSLIRQLEEADLLTEKDGEITTGYNAKMQHGVVQELLRNKLVLQGTSAGPLATYLVPAYGWRQNPKGKLVSHGKNSKFFFKVSFDGKEATLRLKGRYFNGSEKTEVIINGKNYGRRTLINNTIKISPGQFSDGIISVELRHSNPISPAELGKGKNKQKIKYILTAIEII